MKPKEKLGSVLWYLFLAALVIMFILSTVSDLFDRIGEDRDPPATEPPKSQTSDAFDVLWYATDDIDFLESDERWRTSDFSITISDVTVNGDVGVRIDLKPTNLSLRSAFDSGKLQFYLYAKRGEHVEELLSGDAFLMYAALELMEERHGRATLGIPGDAEYLLVMVVADGSVYRATYTPG